MVLVGGETTRWSLPGGCQRGVGNLNNGSILVLIAPNPLSRELVRSLVALFAAIYSELEAAFVARLQLGIKGRERQVFSIQG